MTQASAPPRGPGAAPGNGGGNGESGTAGDASLSTARPGDARDAMGMSRTRTPPLAPAPGAAPAPGPEAGRRNAAQEAEAAAHATDGAAPPQSQSQSQGQGQGQGEVVKEDLDIYDSMRKIVRERDQRARAEDPEAWERAQPQRIAGLDVAELLREVDDAVSHISRVDAALAARMEALEARRVRHIQARRQYILDNIAALDRPEGSAPRQTVEDPQTGLVWDRDVLLRRNSHDSDFQKAYDDEHAAIEKDNAELERDRRVLATQTQVLNERVSNDAVKARTEERLQKQKRAREQRDYEKGLELKQPGAALRHRALQQQLEQEERDLMQRYPGGPASSPEAAAAWQDLLSESQKRFQALRESVDETHNQNRVKALKATEAIRQRLQKEMDTKGGMRALFDGKAWSRALDSPEQTHQRRNDNQRRRQVIIAEEMRKHGLDPDNASHQDVMEDAKKLDWSTVIVPRDDGGGAEYFFKSLIQTLTTGKDSSAEAARVLSDGRIIIHPALVMSTKLYTSAVQKADATDEAKAIAMQSLPQLQVLQGAELVDALRNTPKITPGESFDTFEKRRGADPQHGAWFQGLSDGEKVVEYFKEQQNRGDFINTVDYIGTHLMAGVGRLGVMALGVSALFYNNTPFVGRFLSEVAAYGSDFVESMTTTTDMETGAGGGLRLAGLALSQGPLVALTALAGPWGGVIIAGTSGAGGQYAKGYAEARRKGKTHEEAFREQALPAMATGLFSAILARVGNASKLRTPQSRDLALSGAREFLFKAKGFLKDSGKEFFIEDLPTEIVGTISSALADGRDPAEALAAMLKKSPDMAALILALGAAGSATRSRAGQATRERAQQSLDAATRLILRGSPVRRMPAAPSLSPPPSSAAIPAQPPVPVTVPGVRASIQPPPVQGGRPSAASTASPGSGPGKQPPAIVNNGQAPSASPSVQPPQTAAVPAGNVKPETTTEKGNGQAPMPESGSGPAHPPPTSPSGQPSQTTANNSQPRQTPPTGRPSGPPLSVESSRRLIDNVMARPEHARQHHAVQADVAQAQAVVAAAEGRAAQDKARSRPRPSPDQPPAHGGRTHPGDTNASGRTSIHADANAQAGINTDARRNLNADANTNPPTATNPDGGASTAPSGGSAARGHINAPTPTPGQPQQPSPHSTPGTGLGHPPPTTVNSGQPPSTSPSGQPSQTTANNSQPRQTPPTGRPSGPPRSVESSRRLIANLMARPEHARQHPTVQADLAQARAVVAGADGRHHGFKERLPTERSSRYQKGAQQQTRGLTERAAENRMLRDSRPPRRHAPSTNMEVQAWGAHGEAIRKALFLADHAHDDGTLPRLILNAKDVPSNADGVYRHPSHPYPGRIGVRPECAYPVFTTLHEIGHHVRLALDPREVAVIAGIARETKGAQICKREGMDVEYWLSDSELFSRVYAQWVAERVNLVNDEALQELHAIKDSADHWQQFEGNEWTKIANQMTVMMKKKGRL